MGKSRLLLEVAAQVARTGSVLYVTGEESSGQVRLRAERTDASLGAPSSTTLPHVMHSLQRPTHLPEVQPHSVHLNAGRVVVLAMPAP